MATNQSARCELERVGVQHALNLLQTRIRETFKSPFDVVTENHAYEVKLCLLIARILKSI